MSKRAFHVFSGFPDGRLNTVSLPEAIFSDLLPYIDDADELKVTLLVLRKLAQMRSDAAPWVSAVDLADDPDIQHALAGTELAERLSTALSIAVRRGALLATNVELADNSVETHYFANSPRGRAAVAALSRGESPSLDTTAPSRPNIFSLYEQNIGPLTPMLSEDLLDAEQTYPAEWIEEAIHEAVALNKRSWRYIRAILENWKTEGSHEIDRRDRQADGKHYIQGKYGSFIKH